MIFAHIAGLDDSGRTTLFSQAKQFSLVDLDEFTSKIVSDKNMNILYDKLEYYSQKSTDINSTKLQQKEFTAKAKEVERKMNTYWKMKMDDALERAVKLSSQQIILIGYSTYFKNHRVSITVKATHKFFQKVNLMDHAKNIVEYNLDNYREEIIEGTFPLDFLNHEAIIKKRDNLMFQYKRMGYHIDTINNILNSLHIASSIPPPERLFVASANEFNKKIPLADNKIVAYADDWVAMVSALAGEKNSLIKGFSSGKPFVKEMTAGAVDLLHKNIFLYTISNTHEFSPIVSKDKVYKYLTTKSVNFDHKLQIDDVHERLVDMDINIQTI